MKKILLLAGLLLLVGCSSNSVQTTTNETQLQAVRGSVIIGRVLHSPDNWKVFEKLMEENDIEYIAYGSREYTIDACKKDANKARQLLQKAIEDKQILGIVY
jgi:cell division protein FtsX